MRMKAPTVVKRRLRRQNISRLTREAAKLDRKSEQVLADEGLAADLAEWPEYGSRSNHLSTES